MPDHCTQLTEFLAVQKKIIEKHIEKHKWFRHIEDRQTAIGDFIENYAWLMREVYCGFTCQERKECTIAKDNKYLPPADPK